jgi:septum formation protein
MKKTPLILASASPRRRRLLKQLGFTFRVLPSSIDEVFLHHQSPASNARRVALEKALEISTRVSDGVVVGADTIVVVGTRLLGKPKNRADAKRMLRLLSGRDHVVYTGVALVDVRSGKRVTTVEKTRVRFRKLDRDEINRYVASGAPMDKAGAYGIQEDRGAIFVEKVNGCFYNVVGFPLTRFYVVYRRFLRELHSSTRR